MDNCPTHHYQGEQVLTEFLYIELVYTPTYSPDFNPAGLVFGKIRTEMRYALWELTNQNLILSVYEAINSVIEQDMIGFFKATLYIKRNKSLIV